MSRAFQLGLVAMLPASPCSAQSSYDLLFRGGRVVDGTGAPWFQADVAVRDGSIGRLDGTWPGWSRPGSGGS